MFFKNRKIKALKDLINSLHSKIGSLSEDKVKLIESKTRYKSKCKRLQADFDNLSKSNSFLMTDNINLKKENAILDEKLYQYEKEHNVPDYESKIRKLNGEINSLQSENAKLRKLIETINYKTQDVREY
jgi:cupin superfamily acireductone dioxygenase involved in methionine salvage